MLVGTGGADVANVSADEALLGLPRGDIGVGVGASVLVAQELVAEGILNLVGGVMEEVVGAEEVVSMVVGEASPFPVFNLEMVALFRAEASALSKGDVLLEAGHALPDKGSIVHGASTEVIGTSVNRGLGDGAFKRVHDLNEKTSGMLISS
jgi:hypothetical protein